ncbi:hypothetical protein NDU88_005895 [Pleurodeles waltl]|uniref:Uncharacterized protein n=1 Tax=Pleurodeles waltl TaxID=8319 RepID=A0AAV7W9A1_PLEWA|nr:hypothetical protein NDU88_005895 [Pleurodeles waltl]
MALSLFSACSRLSSNTALDSSDWRCSRTTEESVPRCRGNQGAGACPMTPDFRIPRVVKGENGLRRGVEEEDEDAEEPEETADGELEKPGGRPGNPDVPRETADPMQEERREETRRNRHVPGGAWLSKVRIETQKSWDRGEEGRDSEEGLRGEQLGGGREDTGETGKRTLETIIGLNPSNNFLSP